jgi:heme A synthase
MIWLLRAVVSLLSLQFLLGIWVTLFGSFPQTDSVETAVSYSGDPVLSAHYVLALVLLVLAVLLAAFAFARASSVRLSVSVFWAISSGVEFILSGFSNNTDSFSMAVAFIVAMAFYGLAQVAVLPSPPSESQHRDGSPVASP